MPFHAAGVAQAMALEDAGYSQRQIARTLNVLQTVRDAIRRSRRLARRPDQGRHRCTSDRGDNFIVNNER